VFHALAAWFAATPRTSHPPFSRSVPTPTPTPTLTRRSQFHYPLFSFFKIRCRGWAVMAQPSAQGFHSRPSPRTFPGPFRRPRPT
jgi:hypothetical protein